MNDDSSLKEKVLRMEMEAAHQKTINVSTSKKLDMVTEKMDKLATRMTIITAFAAGVMFVSSETGGSVLRTLLGGLI